MYYVGIDVAKEKHYICILDESKQLACKPFWIYSDITGLKELIQVFTSISTNCDDFTVGVAPQGQASRNQLVHLVKIFMSILQMHSIKLYY